MKRTMKRYKNVVLWCIVFGALMGLAAFGRKGSTPVVNQNTPVIEPVVENIEINGEPVEIDVTTTN